jgi:hypothetical protein
MSGRHFVVLVKDILLPADVTKTIYVVICLRFEYNNGSMQEVTVALYVTSNAFSFRTIQ